MSDLLENGLGHVPTAMREQTREVAYLSAAGFQTREIAARLGVPWPRVNQLREAAADGVVAALRADGYTRGELVRTLGVPTSRIAER